VDIWFSLLGKREMSTMRMNKTGLENLHLLVVEDENRFLNVVASMLRRLGIVHIYTAQDGNQALEFLNTSSDASLINLILCDWNLPHMNGLELLRRVRILKPTIPFIMVTGLTNNQAVLEARKAGVTGFLAKPFRLEELKKKLTVVLRPDAGGEKPHDGDAFFDV